MKKVLFTGGGSAGHVTPNIAIIEEMLKQGNIDVCYMGSEGIEKSMITPLKIPYFTIHPPKFSRSFSLKNARIPLDFKRAVKEATKGLLSYSPDLVFSKGGFVALPVVWAAHKLKIPCLTHESDLSPGLANRLMAKRCKNVLTAFMETANRFKNGKYVGAPLRKRLFDCDKTSNMEKYRLHPQKLTVLVFGGGSGSLTLNTALRKALPSLCKKYNVLHICGKGNATHDRVQNYRQIEFEADMGGAYAVADAVVARAGSNTLFECLALQKPLLSVPLAKASRGDQIKNARYFQERGLIHLLEERNLSRLEESIDSLLADQKLRQDLSLSHYAYGTENVLTEIQKNV